MQKFVPALTPLLLAACVAAPPVAEAPPPAAAPPIGSSASQGALALLPILDAQGGPKKNVFFSPASIDQAFGLLHLGTAGETRAQLEAILPPPRDAKGLAHKSDAVEVRLANALWLSDQFRFRQSYVDAATRDYGATAQRLDFGQPASVAATVNAWADNATEGLIPVVLAPTDVTPDAVAFLTNALYFDGQWATPFDSSDDQPFLFGDGTERPFRLMREILTVATAREGGLAAVRLPYRDARYAMDVIIPERREVMRTAPTPAAIAALGKRLGAAKPDYVEMRLPQFEIDFRAGLIDPLTSLGLTLPFDKARADLSAMAEPGQARVFVDDVRHLAKLQVFDIGTRAAAVTSLRIVPVGMRIYEKKPVPFVVDRPFLVVIRDLERDEILFVGRIADPQPFSPKVEE